MPNMDPKKHAMPTQPAEQRIHNFNEVALGYTAAVAQEEAQRCLNCKHQPCVSGCPVQVHIPDFIRLIVRGDMEGAYQEIAKTNALPAVCGRVCPQENQCEKSCVRGIRGEPVAIGRLERFVADTHNAQNENAPEPPARNGHKVAVVGSGPSGLACAGELARRGYEVTVFEALHRAGGVLVYGIPEFRLPKAIVRREIETLQALSVRIETNTVIGRSVTVDELLRDEDYEAVFIGSGAGLPKFMGIPGESLKGVYSANEFLTRVNLMRAAVDGSDTPVQRAAHVAVVGGGNVAMDAARCARRLGAEVTVVYRRTREELPARLEEVEHAMEEGIVFCFLTNPVEILPDEQGWVRAIRCLSMELGEPDASGRRKPVPVEGAIEEIPVDLVIVAVGVSPNQLVPRSIDGLEISRRNTIVVNEETMQSNVSDLYAGGDIVRGGATVILAMGDGRRAALNMHEQLIHNL